MYAYEIRYPGRGQISKQCGFVTEADACVAAVDASLPFYGGDHAKLMAYVLLSHGVELELNYGDQVEIMECDHPIGWHAEGASYVWRYRE